MAAAADAGAEALLVTGPMNIRYLCGFDGSAGALLIAGSSIVLATDGRYQEQAADQVGEVAVELTRDYAGHLLRVAGERGVERVAAEADHLTWAETDRLQTTSQASPSGGTPPELIPTEGIVEALRMPKDEVELEAIRRACRVTDEALLRAIAAVKAGVSERELAEVFLEAIADAGADGPAFDPIVAFGANAAKPHHRPGASVAVDGEVVLFDVGARVDGYCADISRTVSLGDPGPQIRRIHDVVLAAQAAGVAAVAVDLAAVDVDTAARSVIEDAGFGERFVHGTGHGLGLEIHEPPLIGPAAAGRLGESFTVTVEPGIYLPGVGGVRIEDTVLVTTDGAEPLTTVPRALIEC